MTLKKLMIFFLVYHLNSFTNLIIATERNNSVAFAVLQNQNTQNEKIHEKLKNAEYHFKEKNTETALKLYLEVIEIAKQNNNITILEECYYRVSIIFKSIENYEKAILYYSKSLGKATILNDTLKIIDRNINLASLHHKLYILDSIRNPVRLDSFSFYSNRANKIINNNPKYNEQKATYYNSLAILENIKGAYLSGIEQTKKALQIQIELHDTLNQAISYNTMAGNYARLKKYNHASKYYKKVIELLEKKKTNNRVDLSIMAYSNLAWVEYHKKNYKAYEHLYKATVLIDSVTNSKFNARLNEIEAKHNVDIIKQNAAKQQFVEIQKKKRFQLYTVGLGVCLFTILLVFYIYTVNSRLKHENKDLLFLKAKLIKEKEIEQLASDTRIKILNATLDGKEAERKQIAETLHDSVSALLSAANLHLQASKRQFKGNTPIEIDKTQHIIDEASGKIRNLSHELISSVPLKFGLSYAIQDFCEKYSNSQLTISCSAENLQRYEESFEIKINNIIEELVNNLIKHSEASLGSVSVMEYQKHLYIEIEDNGKGFDTSIERKKEGIGIHQIEARIKMMQGKFKIISQINEGTRIEFMVPILYRT